MICFDAAETRKRLNYVSIAEDIEKILELKKAGLAVAPERIVMQSFQRISCVASKARSLWIRSKAHHKKRVIYSAQTSRSNA